MSGLGHPAVLAGLVDHQVDALYRKLCAAGALPVARFMAAGEPAERVLDLGLAFRSIEDTEVVRPVEPAVALRLVLDHRQHELMTSHRRMVDGWARMAAMAVPAARNDDGGTTSGVRLLTDFDEVARRAAEIHALPARRMRVATNGDFLARATGVRRGQPSRVIYQTDFLDTAAGARAVSAAVRAGDQVRLRDKMPLKMVHVADTVALIAADGAGCTALLVRSPAMLTQQAEWFDLLWDEPNTLAYPIGGALPVLTENQMRVLEMMPSGDDETIARKLKVSVTTVRRHVKVIYEALGVNNRFAAGMAAAKRAWI